MTQCSITVPEGIWSSRLRLTSLAVTPNSLLIEWNHDTVGSGGYFVQYKMRGALSYTTVSYIYD